MFYDFTVFYDQIMKEKFYEISEFLYEIMKFHKRKMFRMTMIYFFKKKSEWPDILIKKLLSTQNKVDSSRIDKR